MRDKTSIIDVEIYAPGSKSYYSSLTLDAQSVSSSEVEEFAVTMTIHDNEIGMAEAMLNYDHEAFELVSCNLTGDLINESSLEIDNDTIAIYNIPDYLIICRGNSVDVAPATSRSARLRQHAVNKSLGASITGRPVFSLVNLLRRPTDPS